MRISDWSSDVCSSDLAVHARHRADTLPNLVAQPLALRIVGRAALDEYGGRFLAAGGGDREGSDVAGLEAGKLLDRPFDVLRPMVAAVDDDHVLGAADDVDVAARQIDRKSTRLNSSH